MSPEAKVLVVDDDPDFLDLLETEIKQIPGVDVAIARGPGEALRLLTKNSYDLIVSDWALNAHTASEVFTKADGLMDRVFARADIAPEVSKVPVVFMSGSEKVGPTQRLHTLRHFEPVSFILKRCGPNFIRRLAEQVLERFYPMGGLQPCPISS